MPTRLSLILSCAVMLIAGISDVSGRTKPLSGKISYEGGYESNIYHVDEDSLTVSAYVHRFSAHAFWERLVSPRWEHQVGAEFAIDAYQNHSNRNRSSIGLVYRPSWQYAPGRRLRAIVDISRRNKDLIDDTGTQETRTLTRWQVEYGVSHRIDLGPFRLEQEIVRQIEDYDEQTGETSYDYAATLFQADITWTAGQRFRVRGGGAAELRSYDARKTYSREFGATVNRPFAIREFDELTVALEPRWNFASRQSLSLLLEYVDRTDNYENFYGYLHRSYGVELRLRPGRAHETVLSLEQKHKDYANYWNSTIGRQNRVAIDYLDLSVRHAWTLSRQIELTGLVRYYDKQSNYRVYQYTNLFIDLGIRYAW